MVSAETKAFQIGEEAAEGEKKSVEIVDENCPLEIDVNVTVGRGEKLGDAFSFVVLPEQHSQRRTRTNDQPELDVRPEREEITTNRSKSDDDQIHDQNHRADQTDQLKDRKGH